MTESEWTPWNDPPERMKIVVLRFDDDGRRDCTGFYAGCYYRSIEGFTTGLPVHPISWRHITEASTISTP